MFVQDQEGFELGAELSVQLGSDFFVTVAQITHEEMVFFRVFFDCF